MKYANEIEALRKNHTDVFGKPFAHFMCPITLRDEDTALQKGHILNDALKIAAKWCVPQRRDVDNHYGNTIEPDLIKWLNVNLLTRLEAIRKGKKFSVELPDGKICDAFLAKKKGVGDRFPKLPICDDDGTPIADVYVKTNKEDVVDLKGLMLNLRLSVNDSAVIGSWLKSAYLALFRRCGYRYVYTSAGDYVRRALAGFFTSKSGKEDAHYFFDKFNGCAKFLAGQQVPHFQNTIEHGTTLVHKADGFIFGLSCLFRVNKVLHMVTLPLDGEDARWSSVICKYDKLLRDPKMPHEIFPALLGMDGLQVSSDPLKLTFEGDMHQIRAMLVEQIHGKAVGDNNVEAL